MSKPLYERRNSPTRGRHLVATRSIRKGEVIFFERPLISLQSLGNGHQGALVCRCCRCFVGGPDLALHVASRNVKREDVWEFYEQNENELTRGYDNYKMVQCRHSCGELYCSDECEENMWNCCGHDLLCTGLIPEPKGAEMNDALHPLLQFKLHACQNNEIFIMVADLIAAAVSQLRQRLAKHMEHNTVSEDESSFLHTFMAPYLDFTLEPWWKVVTTPMIGDPMKMVECISMNKLLRDLCRTSANLLKAGLLSCENKDSLYRECVSRAVTDCDDKFGMFSEQFFGKIIGSFEQNAIGILARNPLCRDILEDKDLRIRRHAEIMKCIEIAGMMGNSDCCEEENEFSSANDNDDSDDGNNDMWDYSPDEIAEYIANLEIDEEGQINTKESENYVSDEDDENLQNGDDLDTLFCPLDGTAMYITCCKMNHSCVPNVIAKYAYSCSDGGPRARWGSLYPLMIKCCALRDIEEGDELCISYIRNDAEYYERQTLLENYGFRCDCIKCNAERNGHSHELDPCDRWEEDCSTYESENLGLEGEFSDGEFNLLKRVRLLDQKQSTLNSIPLDQLNVSFEFLSELASNLVNRLESKHGSNFENVLNLLRIVRNLLVEKNLKDTLFYALEGEYNTYAFRSRSNSWPDELFKEVHALFSMISAISQAQCGNIVAAMKLKEKAMSSGLPVSEIGSLQEILKSKVVGNQLHCVDSRQI